MEVLTESEYAEIRESRAVRLRLGSESFLIFFHIYFSHYIEYTTAEFQKEMIKLASDETTEHLVILAFRASGKSTIMTTSLPLWSIMGSAQKKYVVIVSQTQNQAQQHLKNIALEIQSNELLSNDFFPYEEEFNETGISAINLPKFGARIIAVSREQGVRGLRSGPHRPDLIIADDVEDTNSVKTQEARRKTYDWFTGELLPLGSEKTKFVTVGNLLHEDSLIMRLKRGIESGERTGTFLEYPLVRGDGTRTWPERFPDEASIERLQKRVSNRVTWEREYMLRLVPDDTQIITREMIRYYDIVPDVLRNEYSKTIVGVDLAISENDRADYTAILTIEIIGRGADLRMYIRPNVVNRRMNFHTTIEALKEISMMNQSPKMYVEQVAYQAAAVEVLGREGLDVKGVTPKSDKRSRLNLIANMIESGQILFPASGAEALITQLVGFGVERHDDLVDALTMAVIEHTRDQSKGGSVTVGSRRELFGR